jgi:predicted ester cyclase
MSARELVRTAWTYIESGDMDALADLFHPAAELSTSAGGGSGRDYVVALFTRHREGYPDITHRVVDCIESADGDAVALRLEFEATHLGELRGPFGAVPPTGRRLRWRSADQVRSRNGKIVSWHAQFDRLTVLQQLGLTPPERKTGGGGDVLRSIFTEVFERGDLDALDRYVTPDFVNHRTPPGIPPDASGVKTIAAAERSAFPDLHFTVDHEVQEGDLVIQVATARATHSGRIFGVEATGRSVTWQQVHIARIRDGRMAEHWGVSDLAGLWTQIGRAAAVADPALDLALTRSTSQETR